MNVLMLTNMYPQPDCRWLGIYVKREVDALRDLGVDVDVMVVQGWRDRLDYARALPRLRRQLGKRRYDLVHAYYGLMGLIAAGQRVVPRVVTFVGDDALGRRKPGGGTTAFSRLLARASIASARGASAVIVKTQQMKDLLDGGANVTVIPSGVDFRVFRPLDRAQSRAALGWPEEGYKVLFLGDTSLPVKNFPLARAAVEILKKGKMNVRLVTVENVSEEEVSLHMNACDALLITSLSEGSPNIAVESMACDLPIVSVDVGDVRALVEGVDGCSIVPREAEAISETLGRVLTERRRSSGSAAVSHLDISRVALRILEVYRSAVSRAGRR
jgi:glycosyltransferase involved in cell wall biosynthesis